MSRSSEFLLTHFHSRKLKNPRYSLRAFASYLGVNSGRLSQYFSGQRPISFRAAKAISSRLGLDEAQTNYFFHLIEQDKKQQNSIARILSDDETALVVEWYHAALWALLTTTDFHSDPAWIAERLQLPLEVIEASLQRMERMGLIKITNNRIQCISGPVHTSTQIPSEFLRLSHKDLLRKVIGEIDTVPIEKRDVTSITFAMDVEKLPLAKKLIEDFRIRLAKRLNKGPKNEVVALNVQLFPLTKVRQ